ncbi:hypothetical protein [Chiayiivirga flava]|uniref:TonB C-terminal domain-containing protein n=1 Tax=Chiayiivirga flava TaxID=659595 RepID=A0A7W8D4G8_9GAMM|nr:hypothetical protein [Chiayiivirga flava]MBB5207357.1 hypothetical protein [Chiayiivirga flava]
MRRVLPFLLPLALAGCAATPDTPDARSGQVGVREVTAGISGEARMVLAANETFAPPLPAPDNALPAYPSALLAQNLPPQAVCVQVGVAEDGSVMGVTPAPTSPDCPALQPPAQPFFASAAAATQRWRFEPAFRCVFDRTPAPNEACGTDGTHEVPQAVSLVYRFVFEQVDGRGSVRVGD